MFVNTSACEWLRNNPKLKTTEPLAKLNDSKVEMWQALAIIFCIGFFASVAARISNFVLSNVHKGKVKYKFKNNSRTINTNMLNRKFIIYFQPFCFLKIH